MTQTRVNLSMYAAIWNSCLFFSKWPRLSEFLSLVAVCFDQRNLSYSKRQCLVWAYCVVSFVPVPSKTGFQSSWRHWSYTSRNAKAMSDGARVLADFLRGKPGSLLYAALPLTIPRTFAFWLTGEDQRICEKQNRSPHCLVPAELGDVKGGQERVDLYRKGGEQPQGPRAWQHCWLYTRWRGRASWCWAFQTLNQHSPEFLALDFKFNSFKRIFLWFCGSSVLSATV